MSPCLGDLIFISFSKIMDCACTIFLPKSMAKCDIFVAKGVFLNRREHLKSYFGLWNYTLLYLDKSLSNDQSNCSILSRDITLYKSLMTIKIFSNAKGLQNNNYNMIRLCKLGIITDYVY